jgi:hypothetical protein
MVIPLFQTLLRLPPRAVAEAMAQAPDRFKPTRANSL